MTTFQSSAATLENKHDGAPYRTADRRSGWRWTAIPLCAAALTALGAVAAPVPVRADGGCLPSNTAGLVPRLARPADNVCATPDVAKTVIAENANPSQYWVPNGAYGPQTCVNGRVWREAFDGDTVCVTPNRRTVTFQENANAGVGNTGGLKPQPGFQPGGVPNAQGSGGPDSALLAAVNDARTNPSKYPPLPVDPNGNPQPTANAAPATACTPFGHSGALDNTADAHNRFIATEAKDVVNVYPNMHKTGNGNQLAGDQGGPISKAGYNTTGEIVADGFGSEAAAVKYWMQQDGPGWGHRNLILSCGITDAGAAHFAGGPWNDYWTVDMGAH
jgi:hypothetical protein